MRDGIRMAGEMKGALVVFFFNSILMSVLQQSCIILEI